MAAIQVPEGRSWDPVPEWRRAVWGALGPKHRMLAKDRNGKYATVFHANDKKDAERWWHAVKRREGTMWKGWTWLGWYVHHETEPARLTQLMGF